MQGLNLARSEAAYRASGRPWPGAEPGSQRGRRPRRSAQAPAASGDAIAKALVFRPCWTEGYQGTGLVLIDLYEASTEEGGSGTVGEGLHDRRAITAATP